MKPNRLAALALSALLLFGGSRDAEASDASLAAVAHEDRPAADREQDVLRKPSALLDFAGVDRGMQVADLMAGSGWYAEILSHLVGRGGRVYAQNNEVSHGRYGFRLGARVERPIPLSWFLGPRLANVTLLENELDTLEGLPSGSLDVVLLVNFYHDTYWMGVDRGAMLERILSALTPGGVFVVVDHEAGEGRGASEAQRLHRVEAAQVRREVTAAGFLPDGESDLLRNADDAHQVNVFDEVVRGRTDRFVLRFTKPASRGS